jgi:hypothetical protein
MTSSPTDYPSSWTPKGAPAQTETPATPDEAVAMAVDAFVASLSDDEFAAMVARTRGAA